MGWVVSLGVGVEIFGLRVDNGPRRQRLKHTSDWGALSKAGVVNENFLVLKQGTHVSFVVNILGNNPNLHVCGGTAVYPTLLNPWNTISLHPYFTSPYPIPVVGQHLDTLSHLMDPYPLYEGTPETVTSFRAENEGSSSCSPWWVEVNCG
eukprot:747680-Hanusia_phi.AAC.1